MDAKTTAEFRHWFQREIVPANYSPAFHVFVNFGILISACVFCLSRLDNVTFADLLVFPATLLLGNFVEFFVHKELLHKLNWVSAETYKIHSKWHHRYFTDDAIEYDSAKDIFMVFFPKAVLVAFGCAFLPLAYWALSRILTNNQTFLFLLGATTYFLLYESIHYICHMRETSPIFRIGLFRFLREHHRTHHRLGLMHGYNFNIVFPVADKVFGKIHSSG